MPLCEPVSCGPDDSPATLSFDDLVRRTCVPAIWWSQDGDGGPNLGAEPCLAEAELAWWIRIVFERCAA